MHMPPIWGKGGGHDDFVITEATCNHMRHRASKGRLATTQEYIPTYKTRCLHNRSEPRLVTSKNVAPHNSPPRSVPQMLLSRPGASPEQRQIGRAHV